MTEGLQAIFDNFSVGGTFATAEAFGSGHINDTFRVKVNQAESEGGGEEEERYYILQRINHSIFTRPVELMDNFRRVTVHLSEKIAARGGDPLRETLTLVPTKKKNRRGGVGSPATPPDDWYAVVDGNYWRVLHFIDGATGYDIGQDEGHARAAAAAFARFQRYVLLHAACDSLLGRLIRPPPAPSPSESGLALNAPLPALLFFAPPRFPRFLRSRDVADL